MKNQELELCQTGPKTMSGCVPLLLDELDDGVRSSNQSVTPLLAA
jgi:hypothetical protein